MALALFAPRPNSHPFQERQLSLTEPIKVGRAVAKAKSTQNNGIFDCKVLSRNHAVMWYEKGKFMLQDTKSSNGTYVNNVRLSRGSEESEPCEIKSGDILQFGVEVVENSKNVTHGCIVGLVTLFHEDGTEATGSQEDAAHGVMSLLADKTIQPQELWQLSQFLQDALHREQMLENKLATLQRMISNSHTAAEDTFQGFIQEDKLLSRLETLENQLELVCKDMSEEDMKGSLLKMQDDRLQYESAAKEKLQNILTEKIEVLQKCGDLERSLSNTEDECSHLRTTNKKYGEDLESLMEKYEQRAVEINESNDKLVEAKKLYDSTVQQNTVEVNDLKTQLEGAEKRGSGLAVEVESLQAECDFTKKQLDAMKERLEKLQQTNLTVEQDSLDAEDFKKSTEDLPFASDHATLEKDLKNKSTYIRTLKKQVTDLQTELENMKRSNTENEVIEAPMQTLEVDAKSTQEETENNKENSTSDLPFLVHQSKELEELLMASRKLLGTWCDLRKQDDDTFILACHSWQNPQDTVDTHTLNVQEQSQALKDVIFSNKVLLELINDDLETIVQKTKDSDESKKSNTEKLKEKLSSAYTELEEVRNQILVLGDQLIEEQEANKKAKELAATLELQLVERDWKQKLIAVKVDALVEQLYDVQKHMNLEALDKSLSHTSLESARQLASEMQKQASDYSKAALHEKIENSTMLEENETLKMKITRLEGEIKKLTQENKLLTNMETPMKIARTSSRDSRPTSESDGKDDKSSDSIKDVETSFSLQLNAPARKYALLLAKMNMTFKMKRMLFKDVHVKIQEKGTSQDVDLKNQYDENISRSTRGKDTSQAVDVKNQLDDLQEQLDVANQSLDELMHEKQVQDELYLQKHTQLLNLVLMLFFILVCFGAMLMLDIINVTPGTLPLLDEKTWTEIWEHLF